MKLEIYALRDSATDQYGNPMFLVSTGHVLRVISDEVNKEGSDNQLARHPSDFELFSLGTFDTQTGLFDTGVPKSVMLCKDLVLKK